MEKIKFGYINSDKEKIIEKELESALRVIGKRFFFEDISFIVKEMVNNANKSNLKSVYFKLHNLNINSKEDYISNIHAFKEELERNPELLYDQVNRMSLWIELSFSVENNHFIITVINNRTLTAFEKERIKAKYEEVEQYKELNSSLLNSVDTSEGAGLGIILILLMLKKIGLNSSYLKIFDQQGNTVTKLLIPMTALEEKEHFAIAEIVQKEIEDIPKIPDSIALLELKVDDPNSSFTDLAEIVKRDAALTADLLKIANSGLYLVMNKAKTAEEAIRIIGFDGIKNMIMLNKAEQILLNRYKLDIVKKQIEHSTEVANIACFLAKTFDIKSGMDEIYTAAVLHDIGKIIINSVNPDVIDKISELCKKKGISVNIVESFTEGFNHSIIGAKLAEKWNFCENIITVILNHHSPEKVKTDLSKIVNLVYLANSLYYYKRKEFLFSNINNSALLLFNIKDENELKDLTEKLDAYLKSF